MKILLRHSTFVFILFCSNGLWAQSVKQKVTIDDYNKWHVIENENIAPDGKWISFSLKYNGADTLVLKNTKRDSSFYFPKASKGGFSRNSKWFLFYQNQNDLVLLNVDKLKSEKFSSIKDYQINNTSTIIAMLNKNNQLEVINLKTNERSSIENVVEFALSPDGKLVIITEIMIQLIDNLNQITKADTILNNRLG